MPEIVLTSLSNVNRRRFFFDVDFDHGWWGGGGLLNVEGWAVSNRIGST